MKRRVFTNERGQVLVTYVPATDVFEVAVRPDTWSRWSPPLPLAGNEDDPPDAVDRSRRYLNAGEDDPKRSQESYIAVLDGIRSKLDGALSTNQWPATSGLDVHGDELHVLLDGLSRLAVAIGDGATPWEDYS